MKQKIESREKLWNYYVAHPKMSQAAVARIFHISRARVNQILSEEARSRSVKVEQEDEKRAKQFPPSRKKETRESKKAPKAGTAQIAVATVTKMLPVYIMGRQYEVPEGLTIMKAIEYAGFQFIRGCGCRGGICGGCSTVYRKPGDYRIYVGLACQNVVEPNMVLTQISFYPANRASYDFKKISPAPEEIFKLYPELFRCLGCNACTKVCPMEVEVMDVVSALKQGNITEAAILSFSCIQCGLCVSRCMGELPQYHIFQLARRIYGSKIAPKAKHLDIMVKKVKEGKYESALRELVKTDVEKLKKAYQERQIEPTMAGEDWKPSDTRYL